MADFGAAISSRRLLTPISPSFIKPRPPKTLRFSLLFNPIKSCSAAIPNQKTPPLKLTHLVSEFQSLPQWIDRVKRLLDYASTLPPFPAAEKTLANRVMGCTAQVWLSASINPDRTVRLLADSDSEITKGFCACLMSVLDGATAEEVLSLRMEDFGELNVGVGIGGKGKGQSRANTWHNVLVSMRKRTKMLVVELEGRRPVEPFPSLVIGAEGVEGSFADAQAFARIPDVNIWYGPRSYICINIAELFSQMANLRDEEITEVQSEHNRKSTKSLLPRLHYYEMNT